MTLQPTLPDWVANSSPGHNSPLVPRVERLARIMRTTAAQISRHVEIPFQGLYKPERPGLGFTLPYGDINLRAAWALLGEWCVAASVQATCAAYGLAQTHDWFWHGSDRVLGAAPDVEVPLRAERAAELRALLPYLLDPRAAATRRDVLTAQSTAQERQERKAAGIYYTPGDVAHSMVQRLLLGRPSSDHGRWLDPAHGSGVFLRAAFCALGGRSEVADRIYGVDLDPFAAEAASFVLTAEDLLHNPTGAAPWERWHRFRRNLVTGDALMIDSAGFRSSLALPIEIPRGSAHGGPLGKDDPWRLDAVFPETAEGGFLHVVANPPYAPLQPSTAAIHIPSLHPVTGRSANADVSPTFVELCVNLLADNGSLAVVLPLSVVSSTRSPFPELRRHLAQQKGRVEFLSFDRVPDALFGDDIKTRNAIVYLDRNAPRDVAASPLHRWTSRTRESLGSSISVVSVAGLAGVPDTIPKIGTMWERELLQVCSRMPLVLDQWATNCRQSALGRVYETDGAAKRNLVALAPTAYNFLGVVRDPRVAVVHGHDSQNPFSILSFGSALEASAAFALLSSRLAFWIWHVTGDGFHVTQALRKRLPVPTMKSGQIHRLATLGDKLWDSARHAPAASTNRGRTSVAYPTWPYSTLIDEIDAELGNFLGFEYHSLLARWHERLVIVDPGSARRKSIRKRNK